MEKCLNDIPYDTRSKYKCASTLQGWQELAKKATGNTRMMLVFALNFVGPVSAIWPRQSVAFQFTGDGGAGKSTIAAVSTSTWGWDEIRGEMYAFGTSWNTTVNELEAICVGYNHTILFLDETAVAERKKDAPVDTLDAVMRLDGQIEKGRKNAVGPRKVWRMPILSTSNVSVPRCPTPKSSMTSWRMRSPVIGCGSVGNDCDADFAAERLVLEVLCNICDWSLVDTQATIQRQRT